MASLRLKQLQVVLAQSTQRYCSHTDHIQVNPRVSLLDQQVHVRVHGLPSKAKVTLQVTTQQEWRRKPAVFRSCGHFVVSDSGDLDLQRDTSEGGTYTGLDPMGPFWSLEPCPSGPQNIRMVVKNVDQPLLYTLSLYLGHWSLTDLVAKETTLTPLYSTVVTRLKKAADVRRIPVRDGGVRGMLFLPPGEGPHPGLIDLFGIAGGLMELRAALLASHGFAMLALAYFNYEDLPKNFEEVTYEYFEEAVSWMSSHKAVKDGGIGLVGTSKGAELCLLMAYKCPQVKAAVIISCFPTLGMYSLYRKDGTLVWKGLDISLDVWQPTGKGYRVMQRFLIPPDLFIPVWEGSAKLLILVSDDDGQVDSKYMDEFYSMCPRDKRHQLEVVHYPGAGHLLEPPYIPLCRSCSSPYKHIKEGEGWVEVFWGGNPVDHAAAQEDSWKRILHFLHTSL